MVLQIRRARWAAGLALSALTACVHAPAPWPAPFDPLRTEIVVAPAVPALGYERSAAGLEPISGGGAGDVALQIGATAGLGNGPAPGAVAGVVIAVVIGEALGDLRRTERSFEDRGRAFLAAALEERPLAARLAAELPSPPAARTEPSWIATVELTRLVVLGGGSSSGLRLRLHATLTLQRPGETIRHGPWAFDSLVVDREVLTVWDTDDRETLQQALDRLLTSLAAQVLTALRQHAAPSESPAPLTPTDGAAATAPSSPAP